jgi:hypothetical protein
MGPPVPNPTFPIPPANVNVSTSALIDVAKGPAQDLTLTANANVLLDHLPNNETAWYQILVIQGGAGSFVPTFVGAKTPGGTPLVYSTAPGAADVVSLWWYRNVLYATIGGLAFA